jgi:bleomycin hydrolase
MGGQPSKPITAAESEKLILERLRSFKLEEREEDRIETSSDAEKTEGHHEPQLVREPEGLPVASLEVWIDSMVKDPKNR